VAWGVGSIALAGALREAAQVHRKHGTGAPGAPVWCEGASAGRRQAVICTSLLVRFLGGGGVADLCALCPGRLTAVPTRMVGSSGVAQRDEQGREPVRGGAGSAGRRHPSPSSPRLFRRAEGRRSAAGLRFGDEGRDPLMKPRDNVVVAVVCGGRSAEAVVSRSSGRAVAEALRVTYPRTIVLELDEHIASALAEHNVEVVFPALHGPPGEDGTFQGLLEILGVPYVGSGVRASACAMDKVLAKHLMRDLRVPFARDLLIRSGEDLESAAERIRERLGDSVVVKPASQGSAVGVGFAAGRGELIAALKAAFACDERALVEERLAGREITCGVLEREAAEALPVVEIATPEGSWYDYAHRYTPGLSEHLIPAPLSKEQYQRVQELALIAHEALGCRDLSRTDFLVPEHAEPVVLELNTLPGMTPTSLYPDAARAAGLSFEEVTSILVERALARGR
jgi:D-alanine-D-alanine ligase